MLAPAPPEQRDQGQLSLKETFKRATAAGDQGTSELVEENTSKAAGEERGAEDVSQEEGKVP